MIINKKGLSIPYY